MPDEWEVIEANYRKTLLRQLHAQLKEHQRRKSVALLTFAKDVTLTLRLVDGATLKLHRAMLAAKAAFDGMDPRRRKSVARDKPERDH